MTLNSGDGYWLMGSRAWFEYRCLESPASEDAPAWYRSHQQVTILALHENDSAGMSRTERDEAALPVTYTVRFDDGLTWDVFEDELTTSRDDFHRPDPPRARPRR